jgi:hypothetical protein
MKKIVAALFIMVLMLSASLNVVSMVAASNEDDNDREKTAETEHSHEEEDREEEMEIVSEEDDAGNLNITSEDNSIKFEKEEPQMHFKYASNETEIKFEANDFAIIEFVDENNDGAVQSEEIKKKLEFDEISWNFTHEKTVENNNTIITVTYYTNTTEYEIALVMRVFQRRVTEYATTLNTTLVFDVDGGADEVKFDLIVSRWTWVDESSKLALLMKLESEAEGDVTLESASIDEDQIAIKLDSIKLKVGWVKKAIVASEGAEELVNVTVSYKSFEIETEESETELELNVYFIYPYFGESKLIHDPSVGIEDDSLLYVFTLITPEILLGTAIITIAIAVAAVAFTRRKMKPQLNTTAPIALGR